MGKASRWFRKLLLGKKEDNNHIKDGGGGDGGGGGGRGSPTSLTTIIPATPSRRWSFSRSINTQKLVVNHKSSRSFDSILTSQLLSQALFDYAILQQNHATMLAVPPPKATAKTTHRLSPVAAATKIQAAFRSYLAQKALRALRGLVKLQALVRGHLVRKRTAAMIRCMSALVAIQVRARSQRIQMVEDDKSRSHFGSANKRGFVMAHERRLNEPLFDYNEKPGQFRSERSSNIDHRQSSPRFSIDLSPKTHRRSMRLHAKPSNTASKTRSQLDDPNYMTRTESSRAKARSQSEPRQRPTKQRREIRRTASNEGLDAVGNVIRTHHNRKNDEARVTKVRGSSKSINNYEFDSASTCTVSSSYHKNLYEYEVGTS